METQIVKKTKTPFLLVLAALAGFSDTALADNTNYSTKTFSADCLLFNGVSQIFEKALPAKKAAASPSSVCVKAMPSGAANLKTVCPTKRGRAPKINDTYPAPIF